MLSPSTGRYIPPQLWNKDASKNGEWGLVKVVLWSFPIYVLSNIHKAQILWTFEIVHCSIPGSTFLLLFVSAILWNHQQDMGQNIPHCEIKSVRCYQCSKTPQGTFINCICHWGKITIEALSSPPAGNAFAAARQGVYAMAPPANCKFLAALLPPLPHLLVANGYLYRTPSKNQIFLYYPFLYRDIK